MVVRTFARSVIVLCAICCGCGKPAPSPAGESAAEKAARGAVLQDVVTGVIEPAHTDALAKARQLEAATQAWADSGANADRELAQAAWRATMLAWQRVEVYRFGPAGAMGLDVGGRDLRDSVYSWPTTNACRVDQELVAKTYEDPAALAAETVNVRGLDALEYLLYHTEPTNQCDPARSINSDGSWAALDEGEISNRRAAYSYAAAAEVVVTLEELVAQWDGGFREDFITAGAGSPQFATAQEALNAFSNALLYIEFEVKDQKLAAPVGLLNCAETTCPDLREFVWTDLNFEAIDANLDGFETAFRGGDGRGFDDLLNDMGQQQLTADILAASAAAREAAAASPPMAEALTSDRQAVEEVHVRVKALTDLLKTQFVGVLDLELPDRAEGDND